MSAEETPQMRSRQPRIHGASTTIPGAVEEAGARDVRETWRQTGRALAAPLERAFTLSALRDAFARLTEVATRQRLAIAEAPMFALKGDPSVDPPPAWSYEAVLPICGAARPEGGVALVRIEGGMHIAAVTPRGLADLGRLYADLFERQLPSKEQALSRPYILHRPHHLPDGAARERERDDAVAITVYVPAELSIRPVPVPSGEAEA
jgi:hypothetical protein